MNRRNDPSKPVGEGTGLGRLLGHDASSRTLEGCHPDLLTAPETLSWIEDVIRDLRAMADRFGLDDLATAAEAAWQAFERKGREMGLAS